MNCHYCGAERKANARFCLNCGTKQEIIWPEAAPVRKQPEVSLWDEPMEDLWIPAGETGNRPALQLPSERSLWKMVLFGILTAGIYPAVVWSRMVTELNIAASRRDGKRTMPYFAMVLLAVPTLGIYPLVWMHQFCRRVGEQLVSREIGGAFGPRDFWLWNVLGGLILAGPLVFTHRLLGAMNGINADFNIRG